MKHLFVIAAVLLLTACQQSLDEKAAEEARMYTRKNCPARMGDNIILDSMTFHQPTRTLHYHYTLTGTADRVGLINKEEARSALLTELKNTTAMQAYKDEGFRFAYTYHSQKNPSEVLFKVVFTKQDY